MHLSPSERALYCAEYEAYIERAEQAFDEDCPRCPETNTWEAPDFANDAHAYAMKVVEAKRLGIVDEPNYDPFVREVAS